MEWPVLQLPDKDPRLRSFYLSSSAPQVGIDISMLNTAHHESEAVQSDTVWNTALKQQENTKFCKPLLSLPLRITAY